MPGLAEQREINTKHDFIGEAPCVSLRSSKSCKCHRGKVILLPCLRDIVPMSYFQSAHHPKLDRPVLAVRSDRCCGISHCFHTKHWQIKMFLQLGFTLGLNQPICRMNSLPFSPARLWATGIERKLHHHLLPISISPGLAAATLAALLGGWGAEWRTFSFIFSAIKIGNFNYVYLNMSTSIMSQKNVFKPH